MAERAHVNLMEPTVQSDSFCTWAGVMRRGDLELTSSTLSPGVGWGAVVLGTGRSGRGPWTRLRFGSTGHSKKSSVTTESVRKKGGCSSLTVNHTN